MIAKPWHLGPRRWKLPKIAPYWLTSPQNAKPSSMHSSPSFWLEELTHPLSVSKINIDKVWPLTQRNISQPSIPQDVNRLPISRKPHHLGQNIGGTTLDLFPHIGATLIDKNLPLRDPASIPGIHHHTLGGIWLCQKSHSMPALKASHWTCRD